MDIRSDCPGIMQANVENERCRRSAIVNDPEVGFMAVTNCTSTTWVRNPRSMRSKKLPWSMSYNIDYILAGHALPTRPKIISI